jgi:hypothetical protein
MKKNVTYEFHHLGVPTTTTHVNEIYSPAMKMYTSVNPGKFKIEWHRFEKDTPLNPFLISLPHVAFKVDDLEEAIEDEIVLLGPYEPIDGFKVAVINDEGVPIELVQTELADDDLRNRAVCGEGVLYR